ncbi:hypothetical protein LLG95_12930 [bacterium]|nr:hypothetical protein [bacterium]
MLRHSMRVGDELHIKDRVIILERVTSSKIVVAIVNAGEPYVVRRNGVPKQWLVEQFAVEAPSSPPPVSEIDKMLKA